MIIETFFEQLRPKNEVFLFCCSLLERKQAACMEKSRSNVQQSRELSQMKTSRDNDPLKYAESLKSNNLLLEAHSLTFILKNKSILSATNVLSQPKTKPLAYGTTASMDKLVCTNCVDFPKCQETLGQILVQKLLQLFGCKLQKFQKSRQERVLRGTKCHNGRSRLQSISEITNSAKSWSKKRLRRRAVDSSADWKMSEVLVGQLKLAHKAVDVMDQPIKTFCLNVLRYNMDKPLRSYADVRISARIKEEEEFQRSVYVYYSFDELIYVIDIMKSLFEKNTANQFFIFFL